MGALKVMETPHPRGWICDLDGALHPDFSLVTLTTASQAGVISQIG